MDDEYISKQAFNDILHEVVQKYPHTSYNGLDEVARLIAHMDVADVRPVVRGKWINYGDEYHPDIRCCVCGQRKPILLGNFNFNYCPNCGALMNKEN